MNQFLGQLKANLRLVLMLVLIFLITLTLGINGIVSINSLDRDAKELYEQDLVGLVHLKELNVKLILMGRALRQMIIAPSQEARDGAKAAPPLFLAYLG